MPIIYNIDIRIYDIFIYEITETRIEPFMKLAKTPLHSISIY